MAPFLWMEFNCLKATATLRRQFTFYHSQKFLVLILSTSEGWKAESTLEPPSGFEHGTPGLVIQRLNHLETLYRNMVKKPYIDDIVLAISSWKNIQKYFSSNKMLCDAPTFKGELHYNSWNLTFINKLQFPLILQSFVFKVSKNW